MKTCMILPACTSLFSSTSLSLIRYLSLSHWNSVANTKSVTIVFLKSQFHCKVLIELLYCTDRRKFWNNNNNLLHSLKNTTNIKFRFVCTWTLLLGTYPNWQTPTTQVPHFYFRKLTALVSLEKADENLK